MLLSIAKKTILSDAKIGMRLQQADKNELQLKANLYCKGNLTAWLVYCGLNYRPTAKELLEETPAKNAKVSNYSKKIKPQP